MQLGLGRGSFGEGLDGGVLVVVDIEEGVELGELEEILDLGSGAEELEFGGVIARTGESAGELSDAGAVHVGDAREIQQDFSIAFLDEVANRFAQHHAAAGTEGNLFAEAQASAQVEDGDAVFLPNFVI